MLLCFGAFLEILLKMTGKFLVLKLTFIFE